ncbi:MAG: hypothetical protein LBL82_08035 [Oscillospiraceae bacterium]|jgi:hypothetical protein|nr:hypothetical protein [Oscillospiraceae bacterium]
MKKLTIIFLSLCIILITGCYVPDSNTETILGSNTKTIPVTRIELGAGFSKLESTYFIDDKDYTSTDSLVIEYVEATVYNGDTQLLYSDSVRESIKWVSDTPDLISVNVGFRYGDEVALDIKVNEGKWRDCIVYIHAESIDGTVKSDSIRVIVGTPTEAIQSLKIAQSGEEINSIIVSTNELPQTIDLQAYTYDDMLLPDSFLVSNVEWKTMDSEIVTVINEESIGGFIVSPKFELGKTGLTNIYAQTVDGKVQSQPIAFAHGNEYNKELLLKNFVGQYIINHLRYPTKTEEKTSSVWRGYIFRNFYRIYYRTSTDASEIEFSKTTFDGSNATVTGIINTFTEERLEIRFAFKMKLQCEQGSDFTSYKVLSAEYEKPDLLIVDYE